MADDPHRNHPPLEDPAPGAQAAAPLGGHFPERGAELGVRAGAGGLEDDSRDTRPGGVTRFVETTRGVLSYTDLAPLPGERVTRLEKAVPAGEFATRPDVDLTLEFLAFAERRFLSIHPFHAINVRTILVFLSELLRRQALPLVNWAPEDNTARQAYFAAMEATDRLDWQPLVASWQARFGETQAR